MHEVDHRKANYVMAYLLWLAHTDDEAPKRTDFDLSDDEAIEMRALIIQAVEASF